MSNRCKYYHVYGKATDSKGQVHYVTILGKFEQSRERTEVKEVVPVKVKPKCQINGILTYFPKMLKRKLTLSVSICHPTDEFSEEVGIKVAERRINNGEILGSLETSCVTMLTKDAIMAELIVKLNHVIENIDDYLP